MASLFDKTPEEFREWLSKFDDVEEPDVFFLAISPEIYAQMYTSLHEQHEGTCTCEDWKPCGCGNQPPYHCMWCAKDLSEKQIKQCRPTDIPGVLERVV